MSDKPDPRERAGQRKPTPSARSLGLIGLALLAGALLWTGWQASGGPTKCPASPSSKPTGVIYIEPLAAADAAPTLQLNRQTCFAIDTDAYFDADKGQAGAQTLRLFINNHKTPETIVVYDDGLPKTGKPTWVWRTLDLRPEPNAASDDAKSWRGVLGGFAPSGERAVRLGVGGDKDLLPRPGAEIEAKLRIFDFATFLVGTGGLVLAMAGLLIAGWRSGLLRIRAPKTDDPNDKPAFSLGRVQMAWWFLLVTAGFLFIWLVTGQYSGVMSTEILGFLGISGTTGVAAILIDGGQPAKGDQSNGFFADILSANGSIALHRVQMLAWTVILGLIFVWTTLSTYMFPKFDSTLMLLMGLASGLYVGFKWPEKPEGS